MLTIGNFKIDRRLGAGGMADVWLAHSLSDGHPVAIKTLRITSQDKVTDMEARFAAEVQAVAGLVHPGIVAIYDHGQLTFDAEDATFGSLKAGAPWLAMEYCEGGDLGDTEVTSWSELHAIATTLLEALALTHASGVLHRDLKPGNLLVSQRDGATQIKVADFGLVRTQEMAAQITQAGQTVGTPSYMAPEQILQLRHRFGPPTDLYAAAALLWTLASGAPPFAHYRDNLTALLKAQVNEDPPALTPAFAVPVGLEAWLRRLLSKHPQRRYLFAADALAALPSAREPCLHYPSGRKSDEALVMSSTKVMVPADLEAPKKDGYGAIFEAARPMPKTWSDSLRMRQDALAGTGLGLYRIKRVPVVGRRGERDALWQALRSVTTARTQKGLLLSGPAGSGRRRLAGWIGRIAHRQAIAHVATVRTGMEPGFALTRAIGGLLGIEAKMEPALVTRAIREHLTAFVVAVDPEEQRILEQTFAVVARGETSEEDWASQAMRVQAMVRVVERLSRHRSLVLIFESIENDAVALEFVDQIFAQPAMPVLVLGTVDQSAINSAQKSARRLKALQTEGHLQDLQIKPLEEGHVQTLLNGLLGMDPTLAEDLSRRSAGNPGLAIGLLDHLVDHGMLTMAPGGLALMPGRTLDLPADLDGVVAARMQLYCEDLSDDEGLGLAYGAVLGRRVSQDEWQQACQIAGIEPPAQVVSRFARVGLIELGEQSWRFVDVAAQQHLLADLENSGGLKQAHQHCSQALQALLPATDTMRDQRIGLHMAAGDDPLAAPLLIRALSRARSVGDNLSEHVILMEFLRLGELDSTIFNLPDCGPIIQRSVLRKTSNFTSVEALQAWADAYIERHADHLSNDHKQIIRFAVCENQESLSPDRDAYIATLVGFLNDEPGVYWECVVRQRLGYLLNTRGRSHDALVHLQRAVELAPLCGRDADIAFVLVQMGYAHFYLRNIAKAIDMGAKALQVAKPYPGTFWHRNSLFALAEFLDLGGAHDKARARFSDLAKILRRSLGRLDEPTKLATARNFFMLRRYQEAHDWLYQQEPLPPAIPGALYSCWRANLLLACRVGIKDIQGAKAAFAALKAEQAINSEAPAEMGLLSERIGEVLQEYGEAEFAVAVYRYARERYIEAGWSDHADGLSARMKGA